MNWSDPTASPGYVRIPQFSIMTTLRHNPLAGIANNLPPRCFTGYRQLPGYHSGGKWALIEPYINFVVVIYQLHYNRASVIT